ncbi:hypothetical protein PpBr36_02219 [Pyricularia pennisetigena]|uniref:hypothetical protein n=1 Tax=Pyricularia pennisetigena TaxID=1578925 RepID=UPI001150B66A|nr:hypothetical protein PpBr36_02219 [Pyricularia pennisetigena]TLS30804.1 hypothetical protein PpBr36_02219 [Pyricularia pennisetigena]
MDDLGKAGFFSDKSIGTGENTPLIDSYTFDFDSAHYGGAQYTVNGLHDMSTGLGTFAGTGISATEMGSCYALGVNPSNGVEGSVHLPKSQDEKPTIQVSAESGDPGLPSATFAPNSPTSLESVRKRVADLHCFLFTQLHCVTDEDLAEAILSPFILRDSIDKPTGPRANIIQRLIYASECLLSLISTFSFLWRGFEDPENSPPASISNQQGPHFEFSSRSQHKSSSVLAQHLLGQAGKSLHLEKSANSTGRQRTASASETSAVGLPIITTILTCHVGILSIYRSIFSRINDALHTCGSPSGTFKSKRASPQNRAMTPSPSPNKNFLPLNPPFVLGLRVQLEIMTHMLDRMRAAWAAAMEGPPSHEDQHQQEERKQNDSLSHHRKATLAALKNMLTLNGHELLNQDGGTGIGAVGDLGDNVRRFLRNCDNGMY